MKLKFAAALKIQNPRNTSKRNLRRYGSLETLITGAFKWMVSHGYIGDLIELYTEDSGLQLGVIKYTATGSIKTTFTMEFPEYDRTSTGHRNDRTQRRATSVH